MSDQSAAVLDTPPPPESAAKRMNFNDRMKDNTEAGISFYQLLAGLFLGSISGVAAASAFCMTLAAVKKKDPKMYEKGTAIVRRSRRSQALGIPKKTPRERAEEVMMEESGVDLAMRALKWGTFYSVGGTSLICYGIYKLSGAESLQDFRIRMGKVLPKVPKNEVPVGRTEFSGLNDLLTYVASDYQKDVDAAKKQKAEAAKDK